MRKISYAILSFWAISRVKVEFMSAFQRSSASPSSLINVTTHSLEALYTSSRLKWLMAPDSFTAYMCSFRQDLRDQTHTRTYTSFMSFISSILFSDVNITFKVS
jgi:hypothetical protein